MIYNLPIMKKKEETWIFNEEILHWNGGASISFRSNEKTFSKISRKKVRIRDQISYSIFYDETEVYSFYHEWWTDDAYRTVTFLEPPTGDLLTWLQNNAVKQ